MNNFKAIFAISMLVSVLSACQESAEHEFYGTTEPFAAESIYFVLTDRFVDGDPQNNHEQQGGEHFTFNRPVELGDGKSANIGYLGGDFKGILDNADYIRDMGFTSIWITPIVDNPNQAFSGSHAPGEGMFADKGKSGYHGYWGVNFYRVDEHLESEALTFADFTRKLKNEFGLKVVLDVVNNHGSPSFSMPVDQPMFGELYNAAGELVADHQNLHPTELDSENKLHQWFHSEPDLATLSNLNDTHPEVLDYMVNAYLQWIERGAAAFRVDTIQHMPHAYWKKFSDRIRNKHPGFFMFGESFSFDAKAIAEHTKPENGGISVLDFPGRKQMLMVFAEPAGSYTDIDSYLHIDDDTYHNPYELVIFYDHHDVTRMDAPSEGFIDAHNWLFTSRGIPVVYYGSEIGFMAGVGEHEGNRNYYGVDNINKGRNHIIARELSKIANIRRVSPALQKGLQITLAYTEDTAAFLRVYQKDGVNQSALVLLNKGDKASDFSVAKWISAGKWVDAETAQEQQLSAANKAIKTSVKAHGVQVWLFNAMVTNRALKRQLCHLMHRCESVN